MPTTVATRIRDLDTARPGIRFAVILGHALALGSLWFFGWIESLRPPVPPPLDITLLAPAAVEKLETEMERPFPVPPPAKPDEVRETEPPPGDVAAPPIPPEDVPDINVDEILPPPEPTPPPEPEPKPEPPPEPPQPLPPEPVPPEPSPREPDITEVVQPPLPKPKPVAPKPEPKPVPPEPRPKPKPVPPKPVAVQPKPKPAVTPKPVPPQPPIETVKKPTPAEVEAERMERIRKGLKTIEPKPAPLIAALPSGGGGKTLTANDYEARISAQIRNSVAPIIVSGKDEAASGEQTRDFYAALSRQLYRMWQQPSRMAVDNGHPVVRVSLTILADGTVQGKHISRPSQVPAMDGSVETVLRHLSRAPAPAAYGNRNPSVTIDVAFELQEDR